MPADIRVLGYWLN